MGAKIKRIIGQLFRKKKHSYIPVYLKRFDTLERLISDDRLGIDHQKKLVVLDSSVHVLYMEDDQAYNAFFDTVRAYINFSRGKVGVEEGVEYSDRINFLVMMKHYTAFDPATEEFFSPPKVEAKTVLVGYYEHGKVEYETYTEEKNVNNNP